MQKKRFCLIYLAPVSSVLPPPNYLSRGSKPCNNQFWFHSPEFGSNIRINLTGGHSWGLHHHLEEGVDHPRLGGQSHELWLQGQGDQFTNLHQNVWNVYHIYMVCQHFIECWHGHTGQPFQMLTPSHVIVHQSPLWKYKYISRSLRWRMGIVWWSAWLTMRWTMADTLARYSLDKP